MGNSAQNTMSEAEALAWVAEVFNEPSATITLETPRDSVEMWDSLGVLTLMAEFDDRFDIVLADEDMQAMTKVGDILSVLRQNGKIKS